MTPLDASIENPREGGASFPLKHRLLRLLWSLVWNVFGIWTPTPLHKWRWLLLRLFGAKLAVSAKVYPGVHVWYPPNLVMKDYACLGRGVNCYCMDTITIGRYAVVSQSASLCGGTHDIGDRFFQLVTRPINLADNVWVAAEAFVGPGVTIGEGAVLGARAVLMKDLGPWMVAVGNPARVLRRREFSSPA